MSKVPLRDWNCKSYDDQGRNPDKSGTKQASNSNTFHVDHGNGMKSMPKTAADPNRRNKA